MMPQFVSRLGKNVGFVPALWMVRSKRGKLFQTFLNKDIVALGGNSLEPSIGDIGQHDTREALRAQVQKQRPDKSPGAVAYTVRVLFSFSREIQVGDLVITDDPADRDVRYAIGIVFGQYRYEKEWVLELERYSHVRDVRWDRGMVTKSDLPPEIRAKLGLPPSVYKLSQTVMEVIIEAAEKQMPGEASNI